MRQFGVDRGSFAYYTVARVGLGASAQERLAGRGGRLAGGLRSGWGARPPRDSCRGRRRYVGDFHPWRDYDFLRYFFVDGLDVVAAVSVVEDADHGRMRTRQGADDAAFGAAVGAGGGGFAEEGGAPPRGWG